jgi:hypothetical protein
MTLECKQEIEKPVGDSKDIESEFYTNDSVNDNLEQVG